MTRKTAAVLLAITLLYLVLCLVGIPKELPYMPAGDEQLFVVPAVRMAAEGDLNPRWFGNPGSTTIYPLAAMFHVLNFVRYRGMLFQSDPNLQLNFQNHWPVFYLAGRSLSVLYALLSLPVVYLSGKRAFGAGVGLLAVLFFAAYPWPIFWSQFVRTDASGTFFCILSLWACLNYYDRPSVGSKLLAATAISLAGASRYFLLSLLPILILADLLQRREGSPAAARKALLGQLALSVGATLTALALFTPFALLDFRTTVENLSHESRDAQLGFDGLSPLGNLRWYLAAAIPKNVSWLHGLLAALGAGLVVRQKSKKGWLLLAFLVLYLAAISLFSLHWERWLLAILPVLAILAAFGLITLARWLSERFARPAAGQAIVASLAVVALALPLYQVSLLTWQRAAPSPRVLAFEWALQNLPDGTGLVVEPMYRGVAQSPFVLHVQSGTPPDKSMAAYWNEGFEYILVHHYYLTQYRKDPARYADKLLFYEQLFASGCLVREFEARTSYEYTVQVYDLECLAGKEVRSRGAIADHTPETGAMSRGHERLSGAGRQGLL